MQMSNVIQFLDQAGQGRYSKAQMITIIDSLDATSAQRKALKSSDVEALTELMNGRGVMRCAVATPD
jgi:hypothetical protein